MSKGARTPSEAVASEPLITNVQSVRGLPSGTSRLRWIPRAALIGWAYDEADDTSSIWRWSAPENDPECVVRRVIGRVTEVTPDDDGGRAVVSITRAPDGLGASTARTDVYLVAFAARTAHELFRSTK